MGRCGVNRVRAVTVALTLAAGALLAACNSPPPRLDDAARAALADTVKQRVAVLFADLAHPVPDSILAMYDSAGLVWGRSGSLLRYDSVAGGVRRTWQNGASALIGTSDVSVRVLGRNSAVYSAILSGRFHNAAGDNHPVRAAVTLVLQREGSQWRIVAGHESVPLNAMPHEADAQPADTGKKS
jgi:Domain of unknown function (DUF4440)